MSKSKISYLNISPYSRHSPSLQLKTGLKKQSNSVERPKSGKAYYAGSTTRGHTPINNPEAIDRKYSPFGEGKGDLGDSLRQFYKSKTIKEKPGSAKPSKSRDIQMKKPLKSGVRPLDKGNEKLGIYHYINSKSTKNLQDVRSEHPSSHVTPSRQGSRSNFHDEKDISHEKRIPDAGIFQHKQLIEALEEMRKTKGKLTSNSQNQSQTSLLNKATAQRPPQSNSSGKVVQYSSVSLAKPKKESFEPSRRPSEQVKNNNNIFKDLKITNKKASDVVQPKEELLMKSDIHSASVAQKKQHRRGLSSGQNPLFLEQQLAMEQLALERERMKQMQLLQQQQLQEQQQQLLLQQQQEQMRQMQLQMQQQYARDPQQEEDEFYEEFFHMDKMTFGFEKLMISQKVNQNNSSTTPVASPSQSKNSGHHRTRSIEENISMMPTTKSSSRWNTKKSSIDQSGQERFNMLEQISEFDKSDIEKETLRRYYKQR